MGAEIEIRWRHAVAVIASARDVIDERPDASAGAPGWAIARGWATWLRGLDEPILRRCEIEGLAAVAPELQSIPPDLRALCEAAHEVVNLPALTTQQPSRATPIFRVPARKRAQLGAFAAAAGALAEGSTRIVDVGAGHGHLTRHLAEAFNLDAVGLERDAGFVTEARALAGPSVRFETVDLFATEAPFAEGDLVVGLHACGELSDLLVTRAAEVGARIAFASCCLHRRRDALRLPLAGGPQAVCLPREVLGLGNIALGEQGVEASLAENLEARRRRAGVRALLAARGHVVPPGAEMRGVNRRVAQAAFEVLVARVLSHRGEIPATAAELREAYASGSAAHASTRRWDLPRRMLGPVLEIYVNLDRARYLQQRGYCARVGRLWPAALSPRNVGCLAHR